MSKVAISSVISVSIVVFSSVKFVLIVVFCLVIFVTNVSDIESSYYMCIIVAFSLLCLGQ